MVKNQLPSAGRRKDKVVPHYVLTVLQLTPIHTRYCDLAPLLSGQTHLSCLRTSLVPARGEVVRDNLFREEIISASTHLRCVQRGYKLLWGRLSCSRSPGIASSGQCTSGFTNVSRVEESRAVGHHHHLFLQILTRPLCIGPPRG